MALSSSEPTSAQALASDPTAHWSPPEAVDEYRLIRLLGRGGMGEVYLAHDTLLDRPVAVKFIRALSPDESVREQFLTEARAAARLQHPNVLTVHRVGELDHRSFIVSEFIRGSSLDTLTMPVSWERALELGVGLARGLAAAHRRGVLHRDIKPGNAILADDGEVKLVDFGLAKLVEVNAIEGEIEPTSAPVSTTASTMPALPEPLHDADTQAAPMVSPAGVKRAATTKPNLFHAAATATTVSASEIRRAAGAHRVEPRAEPAAAATRQSVLQGTPYYMAPELWRGEPASRRSDIYALGAVLFELCSGAPPHASVPLHKLPRTVNRREAKPLIEAVPSVHPPLAAIVDRCLRIDPAQRFATGDELREALEQILPRYRLEAFIPEGNPYRGLLPFEAEHRALFFGRRGEIGALIERLRSEPFVLVAGDSGAGKSSLCRAGVLPLIAEGALGGGRTWASVSLVPGRSPLTALASATAGAVHINGEELARKLRRKPAALAQALEKALGDAEGRVLFIDQLEELVTIADPGEAEIMGEALVHLAAHLPGVRLLMTVRSDFLARVASVPGIGDEISRALYFLRPLSRERIREAVTGPARAKGVAFESDELVETLVESTASTDGGLPLLQFALAELWDARGQPGGSITAGSLRSIGGVAGALARHADHVLLSLPSDQHAAARRILMALATQNGTKARHTQAELAVDDDAAALGALEALVRGRLLVAHEMASGITYEIAHEALLKGWATLRRWLDGQAESLAVKQRIEAAAAEWERLSRARDALWGPRQIAEAAIVDSRDLSAREAAFLDASRRSIRRRRNLRSALIFGAPIGLALAYGALQIKADVDLRRRVMTHLKQAEASHASAARLNLDTEALRREAFEAFDGRKAEAGESAWERALARAAEADRAYAQAAQTLETALTIDPSRRDVRDRLGDVLYERALAAERDQRATERDDFLRRMALYDATGERRARWSAPAIVMIETAPSGARVAIAAFADSERQQKILGDARELGQAPIAEVEIEQGSYVLVVTSEGRATVRYPILLRRGERRQLTIDLPAASDVPAGFVYIPPGRFFFGTSADETVRREFLSAVPLHEIETGAYIIARHETTFQDWIEYLGDLSATERALRTPKVGTAGLTGALELREVDQGAYQLVFQPTRVAYTARVGEQVTYRSRDRRASQDWRRFPVSGISSDDASAYAAWLHRTGRVRGARLCTEHEWERAARGADDREFPHGSLIDPDEANIDATYGKGSLGMGPDEVGSHEASRSPFGLDDMTGNIFEWVSSSLAPGESAVRGGAYYYDRMSARSTNRQVFEASLRDPRLGLRVCASR